MPTPKSHKRVRNAFMSKEVKKHAAKIGEIVTAWNLLHYTHCITYLNYMGDKKASAKLTWHSLRADMAQRDLLKNLLLGLPEDPVVNEHLWILSETDRLAQYRNSYAHVAVLSKDGKIKPFRGNKETYAHNLTVIEDKNLFIPLRNDICKLQNYAMYLQWAVFHKKGRPSLRRPKLEAHEQIHQKDKKSNQGQRPSTIGSLFLSFYP